MTTSTKARPYDIISIPDRAKMVWELVRADCTVAQVGSRTMFGTTYYYYSGHLSKFVKELFPGLPYMPKSGSDHRDGSFAIYEYLKDSQHIISQTIGGNKVYAIRDTWNDAVVVRVAEAAVPPKAKVEAMVAEPKTPTVNQVVCPECGDLSKNRSGLSIHRARKHGVKGARNIRTTHGTRASTKPATTAPAPAPVAAPQAPAVAGLPDVQAAVDMLLHEVAEAVGLLSEVRRLFAECSAMEAYSQTKDLLKV